VSMRIAARAGRRTSEVDLHTGLEPRAITVDRYVVKAIGMLPYPGTTPSDVTPTALLLVTPQ
jgi:hypothetical protein